MPDSLTTCRDLARDAADFVASLLEYRSFPANRRAYAEKQIDRFRGLALGDAVPTEYHARVFLKDLSVLRAEAAGRRDAYTPGYRMSEEALEREPLEFIRQALAFEATVLAAHIGTRSRFPQKAATEEMVGRLREAALAT